MTDDAVIVLDPAALDRLLAETAPPKPTPKTRGTKREERAGQVRPRGRRRR